MGKRGLGFYFFWPLCISAAFCCVCFVSFYYVFFHFTPEDNNEYLSLLLASNPAQVGSVEEAPYTARQKRYGVQKDFTYERNGMPLKVSLQSVEAELVLNRQEKATQLSENMRELRVLMQEELFYQFPDGREALLHSSGKLFFRNAPLDKSESWISFEKNDLQPMQVVRYLQADSGSYSYKSDKCTAQHVIVEKYIVTGHELRDNFEGAQVIMKGVADHVEFLMTGDDPHLTIHSLKASILKPGEM